MNLQQKETQAGVLAEQFKGAEMALIVSYQGCKCEELTTLRRRLRPMGAQFAIVKNSLALRALKSADVSGLDELFSGPTAVIWSETDPVGPSKAVVDFSKEVEAFSVKGGILGEKVLSANDVDALAKMPSREELLGKLLALINAPATKLLKTINAPAGSLVRLLGAWKSELEKKG
jgi:large subunit ribosomal protein L10